MVRIQSTGAPRPNALAHANVGNRRILYEEVKQVTALRTALDAQYEGARQPGLPGLFTRAFSSRGASALELPTPTLPSSFSRHPEPRQLQLELKLLLHRHGSSVGSRDTSPSQQDTDTQALIRLLALVARNYENLQNRVALARRN